MKTIDYRGKTYRLPFAELFRPLNTGERGRLESSIDEHGVVHNVVLYDSKAHGDNCVIDGANRLEIAAGKDIGVPFEKTKCTDDEAEELATTLNRDRRHLTPEEQAAARAKRVERVAEKRAEGKSLRAIAEDEGVSVGQVQRDLDDSGVSGDTPEKVTGKDGKPQAAKKKPDAKKPGRKPKQKPEPMEVVEPTAEDRETAAEIAEVETGKAKDRYGIPVQKHARQAWEAVPLFKDLIRKTRELQKDFAALAELAGGVFLQNNGRSSFKVDRSKAGSKETSGNFHSLALANFIRDLEDSIPTYSVCPWHYADKPHPKDCTTCRGLNWAPPTASTIPDSIIERVQEAHGV